VIIPAVAAGEHLEEPVVDGIDPVVVEVVGENLPEDFYASLYFGVAREVGLLEFQLIGGRGVDPFQFGNEMLVFLQNSIGCIASLRQILVNDSISLRPSIRIKIQHLLFVLPFHLFFVIVFGRSC
jgi:hypothetical protein